MTCRSGHRIPDNAAYCDYGHVVAPEHPSGHGDGTTADTPIVSAEPAEPADEPTCEFGHPVYGQYCDDGHPIAETHAEPEPEPAPPPLPLPRRRIRVTIDNESVLAEPPFIIGRAEDAVLTDFLNEKRRGYPNVSREHVRVQLLGHEVIVTDLGSKHRTFVRNTRSRRELTRGQEQRLQLPAEIRLAGNCIVHLELVDDAREAP